MKFESYKTIPSFEQYVIISQDKTHVQTFLKSENWKSISFKKITDTIPLKSIGVEILMEDIFDDVEF